MPKTEQPHAVEGGKSGLGVDPAAIQVVVGCDDGYARHLAVMLRSLFAQHAACSVQIHILVPPNFTCKERLDQAVGEHADRLMYYVLADDFARDLKQRHDLTAATYYRLLLNDALPLEVCRIIYLDCDIIICGDLSELWRLPLGDMIVAAALDPVFAERHVLGLAKDAPYFNAGVLLIDLARWRDAAIGEAALSFAAAHPERLTYNDQCALNWVLRNRWRRLDPTWNLQSSYFAKMVGDELRYLRPPPAMAKIARIVHFNAPSRPWLYMDEHPLKPEYLFHMANTPWRGETPPDRFPHHIMIKSLRRYARSLLPFYFYIRKFI